jgi:hypothetical protein
MTNVKTLLAAAVFATFGVAAVQASDNPIVVELYTSQGCSSCPPADAILHELAERDDVIALALHVDYWDYIGWKDPFGDPAHAKRQRAYAAKGKRRSIYTPEMIVHGLTDIVGAKPMALSKAIAEHANNAPTVDVDVARHGDILTISGTMLKNKPQAMTVHLLRYTPEMTTRIKRGENGGKTLKYANVVEGWTVLGAWDGSKPLSMTAQIEGAKPAVVIVQSEKAGPILAAAVLR